MFCTYSIMSWEEDGGYNKVSSYVAANDFIYCYCGWGDGEAVIHINLQLAFYYLTACNDWRSA